VIVKLHNMAKDQQSVVDKAQAASHKCPVQSWSSTAAAAAAAAAGATTQRLFRNVTFTSRYQRCLTVKGLC
jgi:hypothetical protein